MPLSLIVLVDRELAEKSDGQRVGAVTLLRFGQKGALDGGCSVMLSKTWADSIILREPPPRQPTRQLDPRDGPQRRCGGHRPQPAPPRARE